MAESLQLAYYSIGTIGWVVVLFWMALLLSDDEEDVQ